MPQKTRPTTMACRRLVRYDPEEDLQAAMLEGLKCMKDCLQALERLRDGMEQAMKEDES